jgi:hypothetical protein
VESLTRGGKKFRPMGAYLEYTKNRSEGTRSGEFHVKFLNKVRDEDS